MLRRALQVGRQQLHDEEEELAVDLEEDGSEPEIRHKSGAARRKRPSAG